MTVNPSTQVKLPEDLDVERLPRHVAVIMDGNGRWAENKGLPRFMGHRRGVDALKDLLRCCKDWGIPALTAYAFSTENWHRPMPEVEFLMTLFERVLKRELNEMIEEGVQIRFVGDLDASYLEGNFVISYTDHNQGVVSCYTNRNQCYQLKYQGK